MLQALCHLGPRKANKTGSRCLLLLWRLLQCNTGQALPRLIPGGRKGQGQQNRVLPEECLRQGENSPVPEETEPQSSSLHQLAKARGMRPDGGRYPLRNADGMHRGPLPYGQDVLPGT